MQKITIISLVLLIVATTSCQSKKEKLQSEIKENETRLFNDSTKMLDPKVAEQTLADYKKFASDFPDDTTSAMYLFKAADLAHGMRKSKDAVQLYKTFIQKYPQHTKTAASYFLLGFVYDNDLHQKDSAKIFYREFLEKYPTHALAPSAKASLDQIELGLTDEELVKLFESRLDSSQAK
jgi:TolA-binding protein